jgi:hypothetical protein
MACLARSIRCIDNHSEDEDEISAYIKSIVGDPLSFRDNVQNIKMNIDALVRRNPHANSKIFRYTSRINSL